MNEILFSKAVEGYLLYAHGRRLSEHTLADYCNTFRRFADFLDDDPAFDDLDTETVEEFLASCTDVSKKTTLNYHTALSALWTWAVRRRIAADHVLRSVDPPRAQQTTISIFTEEELQKIINACERSKTYARPGKRRCSNELQTAQRNKAMILTFLDAMVRVSELCAMRRSDAKLQDGKIKVFGKGDKERWVPISSETAEAIWQYIAARPEAKPRFNDLVFLTRDLRPLKRRVVGKLLERIGERAGVDEVFPHKFRHTGATMFLRNGGNVFALKEILGHSTMRMVQRYVHFSQVDIDEAHRQASPVFNLNLRL